MRRRGTGCVMAAKKRAANARREPTFDDGGPDLHVSADERPAPDDEDRPRPKSRKRRARKKRPARNRRALYRQNRILEPGRRSVARDRRRRHGGLGRRAPAADPVAGNSQTSALDPDRGHAGARARPTRRSRRRTAALEGNAGLCAEGIRRHRGSALLRALRHRSVRHRTRIRRQRSASGLLRKAARRSASSSPKIFS